MVSGGRGYCISGADVVYINIWTWTYFIAFDAGAECHLFVVLLNLWIVALDSNVNILFSLSVARSVIAFIKPFVEQHEDEGNPA